MTLFFRLLLEGGDKALEVFGEVGKVAAELEQ